MTSTPYPLILEPILKPKVWGGRRLESLGKLLPTEGGFGESWEVADLASTDPGGGGGGEARSIIRNGALAGLRLHDAMHLWGPNLTGTAWSDSHDFPLLVKYLDAREHLSVQVHPTAAYTAAHPGTHVKSESWYVIDATPGAQLFIGIKPGVDRDDIRRAVAGGTVADVLEAIPAVPGDCHHLPSGTVHALGAGVLVAETQSPSDTTFRLYDWASEYGRTGRTLHIEAALETLLLERPPHPTQLAPGPGLAELATTDRYRFVGVRGLEATALEPATCAVVMCVAGSATLDHSGRATVLALGATTVVPAAISADVTVNAAHGTVLIAELAG